MYKKLILLIVISLLFTSCSQYRYSNSSKVAAAVTVSQAGEKPKAELPQGFSLDKIKDALLEYINYRLWLYPSSILDGLTGKEFDSYINKSIEVEIRVYETSSGKKVYAKTNIGEWLMVFKNKNGFVYCDGQVAEGEGEEWPDNIEKYDIIETYTVNIPEPHKPNYGTSQRKDKMIATFESHIKIQLYDYYTNGGGNKDEEWANVEVLIADFYEYEMGAHAWFLKKDGSIVSYPVYFIEENGEFQVRGLKGYTMESKDKFGRFGRFYLERDKNDAVRHFVCNQE